ncbi:MAG: hypothetical protein WC979_05890 [Candidatus Pacearchaeota archaeon]|jgi:hypothetical protein
MKNLLYFGTNKELNLDAINPIVEAELQKRMSELGAGFDVQNIQALEPTNRSISIPYKYSAKGQAEITYNGKPLGSGKITTVVFGPGEGTGSHFSMQLEGVAEAWTPREKSGYAEVVMALGTGYNSRWASGLISLDEMISDGRWIERLFNQSFNVSMLSLRDSFKYSDKKVEDQFAMVSRFGLTYFKDERILQYPHAVVFRNGPMHYFFNQDETVFQIASFLPFLERTEGFDVIKKAIKK